MQVRAKVRMVHGNALREAGEVFPWLGPGEPPEALCEKNASEAAGNGGKARGGIPYSKSAVAVSGSATRAAGR